MRPVSSIIDYASPKPKTRRKSRIDWLLATLIALLVLDIVVIGGLWIVHSIID